MTPMESAPEAIQTQPQPQPQPQPRTPEVKPPLAFDTTDEDKKGGPVPDLDLDKDLTDLLFREWPQERKRRMSLDVVPLSVKATSVGQPFEAPTTLYQFQVKV
jgi:hypothetical protein